MQLLRLGALGAIALISGSFVALGGCGDSGGAATGGSGGATSSSSTAASTSSSTTGSSGGGGTGGGAGGGDWVPTPPDTNYHAVAKIPAGEVILFNDWNGTSSLNAVPVAGGTKTKIFESFIVWSFGAAPKSRKIAFSSGFDSDLQNQHYGTAVGNAIQPTWLYDPTTQQISLVSHGNLDDECHLFGADEKTLFVCRRTDFDDKGANSGYRVGSTALASGKFTYLTKGSPTDLTLDPAVNADQTELLFTEITVANGKQSRSLDVENIPPVQATVVRQNADAPVFSPDFSHFAYRDYAVDGALFVANADGSSPVKVSTEGGDGAKFSPDGTRLAYLLDDQDNNCSHIQIVKTDGSEADTPTRFRDCADSGEFITALAWLGP